MSRAAEEPLPPPPPNSVWSRIEEVRRTEGLRYGELSKKAKRPDGKPRAIGHYRLIAVRNNWKANQDVVDSFVRAVEELGYSRRWILLGEGERKPGDARSAEKARKERYERRQRAIDELVTKNDLTEEEADEAIDLVRDRPDWETLYRDALEEYVWRKEWLRRQSSAASARHERPREPTPHEPPSVDAIGQPRKVRGRKK